MSAEEPKEYIVATKEARTLPASEILTGRGFVTGKSGSGKSNTMSVIAEELLDGGYNLLVVDTDGEYFGLKEKYQLLHVGADDYCDVTVGPGHAEEIAEIALEGNLPVILDVSGFLDGDEAAALIEAVVTSLFVREKELRKPFLLVVEEMQEYLPQTGGTDDLAELLIRVAKRGRKRGLGICGLSQRPSAVDKDYITQCDWMVWHRLTWKTDLDVARNILGGEKADEIPEFDDGEAYLMTDWDETVERVQFRRKKTFDAGDTPGLEGYERPDLSTLGDDFPSDLLSGVDADLSVDAGGTDPGDPGAGASNAEDSDTGAATPGDQATLDAAGGGGGEEAPPTEGVAPLEVGGEGDGGDAPAGPASLDVEDDLNLVLDHMDRPEPETDDPEELKTRLAEERKRNEILEAEVRELKTIIENVRRDGDGGSADDADSRPRAAALFEEQRPEGKAGTVVETGLLVTYLVLRVVDGVRRLVGAVSDRSARATGTTPGRTGRGYPITAGPPVDRYRRVMRTYLLPGLFLSAVAAVLGWILWMVVLA